MKGKMRIVLGCTASVTALTMFASMGVMAEGKGIGANIENSVWSYRAVADVMTQVNIRAYASTDSAIVGYLPKAAAADVIERGEEWSHVISNGVEGYIKNEYLAYGARAEKLANVYGMPGVEANWDGVRVFSEPNAAAEIVDTAKGGEKFQILEDKGLWVSVQLENASVAYIPSEDVEKTVLLERAIPVVTTPSTDNGWEAGTGADSTSGSGNTASAETGIASETAENTYNEPKNTEDGSQAPSSPAPSNPEPANPVPETPETAAPETEAPAQEHDEPSEETVTNASSDDVSLLAALIYCEAGNQSREGKVAVGAVVLNRVASASFANSIRDVIYESGQFTPAYSGALSSALANGVPSGCYEAAQAALNGENPVPGAFYFNTGSGRGTKIGAHQFY